VATSVHPCEDTGIVTRPLPDHGRTFDPEQAPARPALLSAEDADRLADLLALIADPVRSRLLFALVAADELCVGDLASALGVSDDAVSYALKLLRTAGLVRSHKAGRAVYYRLAEGFPHPLLEHCLRQLLTIAAPLDRAR
jgi:DNA-binding transcriptional ArsR family regulator